MLHLGILIECNNNEYLKIVSNICLILNIIYLFIYLSNVTNWPEARLG